MLAGIWSRTNPVPKVQHTFDVTIRFFSHSYDRAPLSTNKKVSNSPRVSEYPNIQLPNSPISRAYYIVSYIYIPIVIGSGLPPHTNILQLAPQTGEGPTTTFKDIISGIGIHTHNLSVHSDSEDFKASHGVGKTWERERNELMVMERAESLY